MLYFDHNATSPLSPAARQAWLEATERYIGNPSSPHRLGARADAVLGQAREKLAHWLQCRPEEIVWTSGASEANNAAVHHAAAAGGGPAWISAVEHPCVLEAARRHFDGRREFIPVSREGVADLDWLADRLRQEKPALVALMAANNETGVLQPWEAVAELCRAHGVPFLCDASQWLGRLPAKGLGACDFVSGCAHKFGGPQGVGFLKVPPHFRAQLVGGPQEDGRRAGTENVAGILSAIAALETHEAQIAGSHDLRGQLELRRKFEGWLTAALPGAQIVGAGAPRLWNTVSALMPELPDCRQRWVVKLDKLGFAVSTGSACASGKEESSHVLRAMGFTPAEAARALRFSSGWETTEADWQRLIEGLQQAHAALAG